MNQFKFVFLFFTLILFSTCKKDNVLYLGAGIVLTIDKPPDTWNYLRTYLKRNNAKFTFYIENYPFLADSTTRIMKDFLADGHEMAHHSLTHVHADKYAARYGVDRYINDEILPVTEAMKKDGFNPVTFAYPHGDCTKELDAALLGKFKNLRKIVAPYLNKTLSEMDLIYLQKGNVKLFFGAGIDVRYKVSEAEVMQALEKAKNSRQTISLYCHFLSENGEPFEGSNSHVSEDLIRKIVEKANALGLKYYTAKDLSQ
jgi:hypothetical protein